MFAENRRKSRRRFQSGVTAQILLNVNVEVTHDGISL